MKIALIILVVIGMAGCAIFGIFSFNKSNGKEVIELSRSMQSVIREEIQFDKETAVKVNQTWNDISVLWKEDLEIYMMRYFTLVAAGAPNKKGLKSMFVDIIKRTIILKGLNMPLNITADDFGAVLAFPEGVDYTVYWFITNAGFPQLGFGESDFVNSTVP